MTLIAVGSGDPPAYDWELTFLLVLLPSTVIGGIYGWAESARRHGGPEYWRYSGWAPLLFILIPILYDRDFFDTVFDNGLGSGALGVALFGLLGGYAFSGRGPKAGRIIAGAATVAAMGAFIYLVQDNLKVPTRLEALPAMINVTFVSLMIIWIAASANPYRRTPAGPRA